MKNIGLLFKQFSKNRIEENLKDSKSVLVVKYSGVSSPDITALRQILKGANANILVVKNSVARRAFKDKQIEPLIKSLEGPCGLVFVKDEPVEVSKALYNFAKEHEALKLEGGILADKLLDKKDIELLAKLPSKEVLRAQVVMALNTPISGLVRTLNGVLKKFVICLDQIKNKKGNQ